MPCGREKFAYLLEGIGIFLWILDYFPRLFTSAD